ncbi:MFS transporter [Sandarakinorhabdus sp. DWP1-3-1]|uniref:MFS transporter n=1 Tax=Sandarakinorhabdus sp. DWP1-3-1 TaxID=2804627 RepID=UPI003CF0F37F
MTAIAVTTIPPGRPRAEDLSAGRRYAALGFLMVGYFFYAWSWNTVDILRPYIRDSVGMTIAQSGWLYSIQSSGALVGAVVMGQVADRIGRRTALMIVMLGYGSALLAGIWVTDFWQLALERGLMGFFLGSMFPITVGIYSGLFASRTRGTVAGFVLGIYNVAVAVLSFAAGQTVAAGHDWRLMLYVGIVPIVAALFAPLFIPDDRRLVPWGVDPDAPVIAARPLPITELFDAGVRRQTLLLVTMTGLNFFAYQAFTGWATTYLKEVRLIPPDVVGTVLAFQFIAAALGGFAWGRMSDIWGRRVGAWGFVAAALIIPVYLFVPLSPIPFAVVGFSYGFMLSASAVWGPWFSELYPPHLRSTAASIYNWGRIISIMAPPLTGALVPIWGMAPVMLIGCAAFALAALVWRSLPETLKVAA